MVTKSVFVCLNYASVCVSRNIRTSASAWKIVPDNLKGKSKSSQEWLTRHLNDPYSKYARYEKYRCRSAFKLLEIDERFNILRPGMSVVDCGAAPGSWTQVVVKKLCLDQQTATMKLKGRVISVDIQHIDPIKGAIVLKEMDFTKPETQEHIASLLPEGEADVVLSDMAPSATGIKDLDSVNITSLVYSALKFCLKVLKKDGTFLCKTWSSSSLEKTVEHLKMLFASAKRVKPSASHTESSELFLLCKGFKGVHRNKIDSG